MARTGSIPDARDTFPPPPSSHSVEDRLSRLEEVAEWLRRQRLPPRVGTLEESLGAEGSVAKGIASTGLHLALERAQEANARRFEEVGREIAAVLSAVQGVAIGLAADRAERDRRAAIDAAKTAAVDEVRAPARAVWTTARAALVTGVVMLLLGAAAARFYVGYREPPAVTAPR